MYIAVLDEVPDYIVPTLVAHSVLGAHEHFIKVNNLDDIVVYKYPLYIDWFKNSFKKCVLRVNRKEFDKIAAISGTYLGHENKTLNGIKSCAIPCPVTDDQLPNVLKFAKLWSPRIEDKIYD